MADGRMVDLNADLGESFGAYTLGTDAQVMKLITSANVACAMHAGDPRIMDDTVRLSRDSGISIGAHPGFPDLVGFGRRVLDATPREVETDVVFQIGALSGFCRRHSVALEHVKAHGALYNVAVGDPAIANAIAAAVASYDTNLVFVAPFGSCLAQAGRDAGLQVALEGFADRAYTADGRLASRRLPGSVIHDPARAAERAVQMIDDGTVETIDGATLPIQVHTICVHGDNPNAVEILTEVRSALAGRGIGLGSMRTVLNAAS
ncbi:MAG: LamB/YcsF family protein [Candidatus Dormibacteria bacterium]